MSSAHEGVSHKMGDRKFKCKGGHHITSSHDHIRLHIMSMHEKNQEKKFKCDKCGYASVDKLRLKVQTIIQEEIAKLIEFAWKKGRHLL